MRIAFAGTPEFASISLQAILNAGDHEVCLVLTQPERPSGRGRKRTPGPVKRFALKNDLTLQEPTNLGNTDALRELNTANIDVLVVAAYGLLLPPAALSIPHRACINVHASLLPRWRGAAPIERAILHGDPETGISIMEMEETLDTGPIYTQARCNIGTQDTAATLTEKLANLGAQCLLQTLRDLDNGTATTRVQDGAFSNHAHKIEKSEARLDWNEAASLLQRKVRAFNPRPVATAKLFGRDFKIWRAETVDITEISLAPGSIAAATNRGIDVATGSGLLRVTHLQAPGKKPMAVRDFINGNRELLQSITT